MLALQEVQGQQDMDSRDFEDRSGLSFAMWGHAQALSVRINDVA